MVDEIPLAIFADSVCSFSARDVTGRSLIETQLIVWDKVVMQHKHAIEAVDQSLRDLMHVDLPFGGKVVLFAGDFWQTLPIVMRHTL